MGRSFSSIFGCAEAFLGLAELLLEVTNPSVHRAQILLGGEIQSPRDLLEVPVGRALDTAPQAKRPNGEVLYARVSHEPCDSRILHEPEDAFLDAAHRLAVTIRSRTAASSPAAHCP
jgi:hypothetical protein